MRPGPTEYDRACNLRITSPRTRAGRSRSARLSRKDARRLFTRGVKGYVQWGKAGGKNVVCKKINMTILEKRGRSYYIPGTGTRVSKKYLSAKSFPTRGVRFLK